MDEKKKTIYYSSEISDIPNIYVNDKLNSSKILE